MKKTDRSEYLARDSILKLLSDAEIASVSTAETAAHLVVGEEYLDLQHIDLGVLKASGVLTPMGRVLPRSAVQAATWTQILRRLPASKGGSSGKAVEAHAGTAAAVVGKAARAKARPPH